MDFFKYHGTGNDFILIDNRSANIQLTTTQIAHLCSRHFGIGADGLMLLEHAEGFDFRMVYYNSDGGESTMCGNGGRCMVAFAQLLGIVGDKADFLAIDGAHQATISPDGMINLHMNDVKGIESQPGFSILNTGSPHFVQFVPDVNVIDVFHEGKKIRHLSQYQPGGINVNFVQLHEGKLKVRTYERGVEDETLSCGTGVTAAAIAATAMFEGIFATDIETPGGHLVVTFTKDTGTTAKDVVLTGPAVFVFKGAISI